MLVDGNFRDCDVCVFRVIGKPILVDEQGLGWIRRCIQQSIPFGGELVLHTEEADKFSWRWRGWLDDGSQWVPTPLAARLPRRSVRSGHARPLQPVDHPQPPRRWCLSIRARTRPQRPARSRTAQRPPLGIDSNPRAAPAAPTGVKQHAASPQKSPPQLSSLNCRRTRHPVERGPVGHSGGVHPRPFTVGTCTP